MTSIPKIVVFSSYLLFVSFAYSLQVGKSINPGLAVMELVVVNNPSEFDSIKWSREKIYLLPSTPPTIKPIAGVITASPGSMISHVQLLCRSLGIPNVSISEEEFQKLKVYSGQKILLVSLDQKTAIVKPYSEITPEEFETIKQYQNEDAMEPVTLGTVDENSKDLFDLKELSSEDSGKISGPKSANLASLKKMFPEMVSDGFVVSFATIKKLFQANGILDLLIKLNDISDENEIKKALSIIRSKIALMRIPFPLEQAIKEKAYELLDQNNGSGLFVRSDTNVEDLAKFSSAGLNLTTPNVINPDLIIKTIKDVWASPWTERAYTWRKKYVKNPEAILPSALIMQSVNSHKAGVIVTKNLDTQDLDGIYISIMEGLGFKVVDGLEKAEEWVINLKLENLYEDLISGASATTKFILDNANGGMKEVPTEIDLDNEFILTDQNAIDLYEVSQKIKASFGEHKDVWDIEFGILESGEVKLFQTRPFIENMSGYKKSILQKFYE